LKIIRKAIVEVDRQRVERLEQQVHPLRQVHLAVPAQVVRLAVVVSLVDQLLRLAEASLVSLHPLRHLHLAVLELLLQVRWYLRFSLCRVFGFGK
jgi:hypothetical protein